MQKDFFVRLAEEIRPIFGKVAIILHGSRIRGDYYPASDLDVLVITERCLGRKGLNVLYSIAEEVNGVKLDYQLVCYKNRDYWLVRKVMSSPHVVVVDDLGEFN